MIEDRIARDEAEVLQAVRAMMARGYTQELSERIVAMTVANNELLSDIRWTPVRD